MKYTFIIPLLLIVLSASADLPTDPLIFEQHQWDAQVDPIGLVAANEVFPDEKSEVLIAICISGINLDHEDLQGKLWTNDNEIPNNGIDDDNNGWIDDYTGLGVPGGYDYDHGLPGPWTSLEADDFNGSGTFVAGLIAAIRDNGLGGAGMVDNVKLLPIRGPDPSPIRTLPNQIYTLYYYEEAIDYAIDQGADICVLSSIPRITADSDTSVFRRAHDAGMVIIMPANSIQQVEPFLDSVWYDNLIICPDSSYGEDDYSPRAVQYMDFAVNMGGFPASSTSGASDAYLRGAYLIIEPDYQAHQGRNIIRLENLALVTGCFAWTMARFPDESYQQIYTRLHAAGEPYKRFKLGGSDVRAIKLSGLSEEAPEKLYQRIIVDYLRDVHRFEGISPVEFRVTSGLPVDIEVLSGPVVVDSLNRILPTGGTGNVTLKLSQPGNDLYAPAEERIVEFKVIDIGRYTVRQEIPSTHTYQDKGLSLWRCMAVSGDYMLASNLEAYDKSNGSPCAILFHREASGWTEVNRIKMADMYIPNTKNITEVEIEALGTGFVLCVQARIDDSSETYRGRVAVVSIGDDHSIELSHLENYDIPGFAEGIQVSDQMIQIYRHVRRDAWFLNFTWEDGAWSFIGDFTTLAGTRIMPVGDNIQLLISQSNFDTYVMEWTGGTDWLNKGPLLRTTGQKLRLIDPDLTRFDGERIALSYSLSGVSQDGSGRVELFKLTDSAEAEFEQILYPDDAFPGQEFGRTSGRNNYPLAISSDWIVVGAPAKPLNGKMKPEVYLFKNQSGHWEQVGRVQLPRDPDSNYRNTTNSPGVCLSGNNLIISFQASLYWVDLSDLKKLPQDIEWHFPKRLSSTTKTITLNAESTSGTPVLYEVVSGEAIIDGDTLVVEGVTGEIVIQAIAQETVKYEESTPMLRTLVVTDHPVWSVEYEEWCSAKNLSAETSDPFMDADGDGLANLFEFTFGSDPKRDDAYGVLETAQVDGLLSLQFSCRNDGAAPRMFLEQASGPDFIDAVTIQEIFPMEEASGKDYIMQQITLPALDNSLFYRLRIEP